MPDELSVRQWQDKFRAGAFDSPDFATQCRAGWCDWFCNDEALAGRLHKLARVVMGVTDPFILDNYYVCFKNNCPMDGPLYDDVRFEPLSGERNGKYFVVALDSPRKNQNGRCTQSGMDLKRQNLSVTIFAICSRRSISLGRSWHRRKHRPLPALWSQPINLKKERSRSDE